MWASCSHFCWCICQVWSLQKFSVLSDAKQSKTTLSFPLWGWKRPLLWQETWNNSQNIRSLPPEHVSFFLSTFYFMARVHFVLYIHLSKRFTIHITSLNGIKRRDLLSYLQQQQKTAWKTDRYREKERMCVCEREYSTFNVTPKTLYIRKLLWRLNP